MVEAYQERLPLRSWGSSSHKVYSDYNEDHIWSNVAGSGQAPTSDAASQPYGQAGDVPLMTPSGLVAMYRQGQWFVDSAGKGFGQCDGGVRDFCVGPAEGTPTWGGLPGDEPYFNGLNLPGIFRAGQWFEMGGVSGGQSPGFGIAGDIPTYSLGKVGIFRPSTGAWCFDNDANFNWSPGVDICYTGGLGSVGDQPVVTVGGMIGVYRASNHTFYFDQDGNKQWSLGDTIYADFASAGELSIRASR